MKPQTCNHFHYYADIRSTLQETHASKHRVVVHAYTHKSKQYIYRHKYTRMYTFHKHTLCNVPNPRCCGGAIIYAAVFLSPLCCAPLKGLTTAAPPLAQSHILPHRERGTDLLSACRLCQSAPFSPYWLLIVKMKVKRLHLKAKLYMCIVWRASV